MLRNLAPSSLALVCVVTAVSCKNVDRSPPPALTSSPPALTSSPPALTSSPPRSVPGPSGDSVATPAEVPADCGRIRARMIELAKTTPGCKPHSAGCDGTISSVTCETACPLFLPTAAAKEIDRLNAAALKMRDCGPSCARAVCPPTPP